MPWFRSWWRRCSFTTNFAVPSNQEPMDLPQCLALRRLVV
jgi:hypothetical protein